MSRLTEEQVIRLLYETRQNKKLTFEAFMRGVQTASDDGDGVLIPWRGVMVRVKADGSYSAAYSAHRARFARLAAQFLSALGAKGAPQPLECRK